MAREFIEKQDTLNDGREKLNRSITRAYDADEKSDEAIKTSNEAKQTSEEANDKSDYTQVQLDTVTGAGTIDPAVEQLKVGSDGQTYPSPDARIRSELEKVTAELTQNKSELTQLNTKTSGRLSLATTEYEIKNAIWSWWIYPLAVVEDGKTFFGHTDNQGIVSINSYDHATLTFEKTNLIQEEVDDHNAPAIIFTDSGYPIVFYSRHNRDNLLRYRKGTNRYDISELGEEKTITMPGTVTYAQAQVDGDGYIHLFTRVGSWSWYYLLSKDGGESWEINKQFINFESGNQGYLKIKFDVGSSPTIRIAFVGHPSIGNVHDIYYAYIQTRKGRGDFLNVLLPGSVKLGNLEDDNWSPLSVDDLIMVHNATANGKKARLFDVSSGYAADGHLNIIFAEFTDHTDAVYKYATWTGNSFTVRDMVPTGSIIGGGTQRNYFGGAYIPPGTRGEVLLSREKDGIWYIEKWITRNGGKDWEVKELDVSSDNKLFRPVMPLNAKNEIFWVSGKYSATNFTDYDTNIKFLTSGTDQLQSKIRKVDTFSYSGRLTLENGWEGRIDYALNGLNQLHLRAHIHSGSRTNGTVIGTLPPNLIPLDHVVINAFDRENLKTVSGIFISSQSGVIAVRGPFEEQTAPNSTININTLIQL